VGLFMLFTLVHRSQLDVNVVPDRNPLFVTLSDGAVRNGYTVKILNKRQEERVFRLGIEGLPGASMEMVGDSDTRARSFDITVPPDRLRAVKIYVTTGDPEVLEDDRRNFHFQLEELGAAGEPERARYDAIFHAPGEKE
jgi:polyferredoxin